MNNKKKIGDIIFGVLKWIAITATLYIFASITLNIFTFMIGCQIPIVKCYKIVGIWFIGASIVAFGLYAMLWGYIGFITLLKDKFGIIVRHRKKFIWIKSPITITKVK